MIPDLNEIVWELILRHVFLYKEGVSIPEDLILYQTSPERYYLELAVVMDLERML